MVRSRRKTILFLSLGALLILGGFLYWLFRPNPQVTKVKEMRRELFAESSRKLSPLERRERFEELRKEQAKLTPAERKQLAADARKARKAELEHYFTLSKAEKTKLLDKRIDQMEAMRKQMQAAGSPGRGSQGGTGSGNTLGFPQGAGGANGGSGRTPEERERWRKEMLDSTTPEERAQMDQFRKDLQARRTQRGLPSSPGGWGGRP
jgi:hypothetical protein